MSSNFGNLCLGICVFSRDCGSDGESRATTAISLLYKYLSDFGGVHWSLNNHRFGYDGVEVFYLSLEQIRSILTIIFDPEYYDTQLIHRALAVLRINSSI